MAKSEARITNIWQKMKFVCGKEDANGSVCGGEMQQTMIVKVPALQCTKCQSYVSFYDIEKFASHITKESVQASIDDEDIDFTNYKHKITNRYTKDRIVFDILEDKKGNLTVAVSKESLF